MMKKAFVIAAAVLLIVSLSSCSGGSSGPVSSGGEESPSSSQPASIGDPSQPRPPLNLKSPRRTETSASIYPAISLKAIPILTHPRTLRSKVLLGRR